jgi:hypothetical protein
MILTIVLSARFNKTCQFIIFLIIAKILLPQEKIKKEIKQKGIGVKLTFEAKCFHKWIKVYNHCKYKTPNPPKIIVEHHNFFKWFMVTKM